MIRLAVLMTLCAAMFGCESTCEKKCSKDYDTAMKAAEAAQSVGASVGVDNSQLLEASKNLAKAAREMCKTACR